MGLGTLPAGSASTASNGKKAKSLKTGSPLSKLKKEMTAPKFARMEILWFRSGTFLETKLGSPRFMT